MTSVRFVMYQCFRRPLSLCTWQESKSWGALGEREPILSDTCHRQNDFCIRVGSKTTKTCKCWTCCTGMPLFCQASENENPPALKIISILLTQDLFPRMFYEQEIPFYTRPCVYSFCHFLFFLNGDNCTTGDTVLISLEMKTFHEFKEIILADGKFTTP